MMHSPDSPNSFMSKPYTHTHTKTHTESGSANGTVLAEWLRRRADLAGSAAEETISHSGPGRSGSSANQTGL